MTKINLTSAARGTTNWTYQYDALDAITSETLAVDSYSFATSYTRNANGFITHRVTPGGRTLSYMPDGFGRPTRVETGGVGYATAASYHPSGGLASLSYGNGHSFSASYDARHLMTAMSVSGSMLGFSYSHDANGRVTAITDNVVAGQNRSFGYDGLGRLATASGPWGSGSFLYDPLGNVRQQVLGSRTVDVDYNAQNRVSQARDSATGYVWRAYGYDSRGNTTSNGQFSWTYDRSEQPVSMSGGVNASFVYACPRACRRQDTGDAHRRRVRQTINGETIYSVYTSDGAMIYRQNVTSGEATDYLRLGSRTIARLATTGGSTTATYTYGDHLGSPAAAANAWGGLVWREDYTALPGLLRRHSIPRIE